MKAQLYFANLKRAITGTIVGGSFAMDVNVVQSTFPGANSTVKETRIQDCSSTNINNNAGAFVQITTAAALANAINLLKVSCTFGEPITIRKGANAGAAAANPDLCILNQGQTGDFPVSLIVGDRIWVRSLSGNSVSSGYLTVNLVG